MHGNGPGKFKGTHYPIRFSPERNAAWLDGGSREECRSDSGPVRLCGEARPRRWYLLLGHEFTAGCPSVGKHHPRPITYLSDASYISLSANRSTFRRRLHHVLRCVCRFSIFYTQKTSIFAMSSFNNFCEFTANGNNKNQYHDFRQAPKRCGEPLNRRVLMEEMVNVV